MPLELLQDSDSSLVTIGPHWPSSYPEHLSPHQGKDEQQRIVWARLQSQRSNLAKSLREQKERYLKESRKEGIGTCHRTTTRGLTWLELTVVPDVEQETVHLSGQDCSSPACAVLVV